MSFHGAPTQAINSRPTSGIIGINGQMTSLARLITAKPIRVIVPTIIMTVRIKKPIKRLINLSTITFAIPPSVRACSSAEICRNGANKVLINKPMLNRSAIRTKAQRIFCSCCAHPSKYHQRIRLAITITAL